MSWRNLPGLRALDGLAPRDKRALRIGIAIILPAAVVVLGVRPYRSALEDARERVVAERDALARELELLQTAGVLPDRLEEAVRMAQAADLRLLDAASLVLAEAELSDLLESRAARSRVLLREIESVPPLRGEEPPSGAETLRLSVSGESDLEGVMTFLDGLESAMVLIRVRGLALEPVLSRPEAEGGRQSEPAPTGVVEFRLIIESYMKSDATPASVALRS
jgi:hypothetical protein